MTTRSTRGVRLVAQAPSRRASPVLAAVIAPAFVLGAGAAAAQDLGDQQSVAIGDADLYPSLRIDYRSDDNVGLRDDDEVEATAVVFSPRLDFVADRRQLRFSLGYGGIYSTSDEPGLEYADHALSARLAAELDARRRGAVGLRFSRRHEALGFDLTRGLGGTIDEPLAFDTVGFESRFEYGAREARGNVRVGLDAEGRDYETLAGVTEGRDYTAVTPYAAFGYRVSGDTRAIVELRFSSVAFEDDEDDRDELSLLGGAEFTATGRLEGGFRLGLSRASFAQAGVDDELAFVASAELGWRPREAALISLELEREFDNTTSTRVGEDQSIRTGARLAWEHDWSARFSSEAFAELSDVQRACPERATSTGSIGAELGLSVRRWLEIGASVAQASRSADDCPDEPGDALEFDRTLYGAYVRATL